MRPAKPAPGERKKPIAMPKLDAPDEMHKKKKTKSGKRRANGEGCVFERPNDKGWGAYLTYPDGSRKWFYGKKQEDVLPRVQEAKALRANGLPVPENCSLSIWLDRWLEESIRRKRSPKTYASYAQMVRLHIRPQLGRYKLRDLRPQVIQSWLDARAETKRAGRTKKDQKLSDRTVQYMHNILRSALGAAVRMEVLPYNPASKVHPPGGQSLAGKALDMDQVQALLGAAAGHPKEPMLLVSLGLGLRPSELHGVRWSDVDLLAGKLTVAQTSQRIEFAEPIQKVMADGRTKLTKSRLVKGVPKTDRSSRTLDLPSTALAALNTHRVRQLEERLVAGERWVDQGLVFSTSKGTAFEHRRYVAWFKAMLKEAALPEETRVYDLRHTCATYLAEEGESAWQIADLLGHSTIQFTMDTYRHPLKKGKARTAATADGMLVRKAS